MTHTYQIAGMTCNGCVNKVRAAIAQIPEVNNVNVTLNPPSAVINMSTHIPTEKLKAVVKNAGNFTLSESGNMKMETTESASTLKTYTPLIVVFLYITGGVILHSIYKGSISAEGMMMNFMGGFFLVFSLFKMINLSGFADSYSSYDIIARKWRAYGYIYPFIELALGMAYFTHFNPLLTNVATVIVMGVSSIGVIRSLVNKRKIQCACLGAVFNLPMSTITLVEDGLMVLMAGIMVVQYFI